MSLNTGRANSEPSTRVPMGLAVKRDINLAVRRKNLAVLNVSLSATKIFSAADKLEIDRVLNSLFLCLRKFVIRTDPL